MSLSRITSPNSYTLYGGKVLSADVESKTITSIDLECGDLAVNGKFGSDGGLIANPGISFSDVGEAFIVAGNFLRFGKNSSAAGVVMAFSNGGEDCNLTVNGTITSDNSLHAKGSASWSGGGSSLTVAVPNLTSSDHVHITPTSPSSEPAELSHVVAGTG